MNTPRIRQTPTQPISIMIEQLDENGKTYRIFTRRVWAWELDEALETIARAYNLDRTRITHNG